MEMKVNDINFGGEVLRSEIPVLVDFWAEWCGPCRVVAPVVKKIAKAYQGKLKVCKIDIENAPITAARFGIMSIPTLAIFKSGKEVEQVVGAMHKAEQEKVIKPHI